MKKVLSIILIFGLALGVYVYKVHTASASCGNGFSYCRTVTIDHTKVPNTDQASFPIEVCANSTPAVGSCATVSGLNQSGAGAHVQNSNGYDIIFTTDSACTTKVTAWEMEKYVASTGEMVAWVNDGTLSHSSDTVFYMCYGKSSISTFQSTASNVWDSNYKGVYHFPDGSTLGLSDSTSNANTGTNNSATATTGQADGGIAMSGSSQYVNVGNSSSIGGILGTTATIEAWVKPTDFGNYNGITSKTNGNLPKPFDTYLAQGNGQLSFFIGDGSTYSAWVSNSDAVTGSWQHLVFQVTSAGTGSEQATFYKNGTSIGATRTVNPGNYTPASGTDNVYIGTRSDMATMFKGSMDELRISNNARSADWVSTEYNNQSSPSTFVTFGSESAATVTVYPILQVNNGSLKINNGSLKINFQ